LQVSGKLKCFIAVDVENRDYICGSKGEIVNACAEV
jgi:hypothetical protein